MSEQGTEGRRHYLAEPERHVRGAPVRVLGVAAAALVTLLLTVGCGADGIGEEALAQTAGARPNILFIMTDDMDEKLLTRMPVVQGRVVNLGVRFNNAFVTHSLCCPSRATFLRGQYSHNHHIEGNNLPDGGAVRFRQLGLDQSTFATWLRNSGYKTGLVGKYLNNTEGRYVPPGWSAWYGMVGSNQERKLNENGTIRYYPRDKYGATMTDVYRNKALGFLNGATDQRSDPPFMLWVGTFAPHQGASYADRHAKLFRDAKLPKPPSFNEVDVSDKPQWVRRKPRLSADKVVALQEFYRNRLRSLKAVDEMVGTLLDLLKKRGELSNTYVVFTTDNGVHMGEHRLEKKRTPYEEAAGVPLVIRGPGVPAGAVRSQLVANNDLAPTFADVAGVSSPEFVDGRSLKPVLTSAPPADWRTAVMIERHPTNQDDIPRYEAIRTQDYTYVEYETGEKELYDLRTDPYQLSSKPLTGNEALYDELGERLGELSGCVAEACRVAEGP